MDTAAISVVATGAIGLAGVLSPFALRRREEAREEARRRDQRFDELRAVIDEACMALVYASERAPNAGEIVRQEDARRQAHRLEEAAHELYAAGARMAARLGAEHEIVKRYDDIWRSTQEMIAALRRGARNGSLDADEVRELKDAFESAQRTFFDASARRIGPRRG
jgi:hypothetical protein